MNGLPWFISRTLISEDFFFESIRILVLMQDYHFNIMEEKTNM